MNTNLFRIGDQVRICNYRRDFNGRNGKIVGINGEYHYIDLTFDGTIVNIEVYRNEMIKIDAFREDLFKI